MLETICPQHTFKKKYNNEKNIHIIVCNPRIS